MDQIPPDTSSTIICDAALLTCLISCGKMGLIIIIIVIIIALVVVVVDHSSTGSFCIHHVPHDMREIR